MTKYDDIINLQHFHAPNKPFMSNSDRAAQFMPFKSLNSFEESISSSTETVLDEKWEEFSADYVQDFPDYSN